MLPSERSKTRTIWVDNALQYGRMEVTRKDLRHSTKPLENAEKWVVRSYKCGNRKANKARRHMGMGAVAWAQFQTYIDSVVDTLDA